MPSRRIVYVGHRWPAFNKDQESQPTGKGVAAQRGWKSRQPVAIPGAWASAGGLDQAGGVDVASNRRMTQGRAPGSGHLSEAPVKRGESRPRNGASAGSTISDQAGGTAGREGESQHLGGGPHFAPGSGHLVSQWGGGVGTEGRHRAALGGIAAAPAGLLDRLVPWVTAVCLVVGVLLYVMER